MNTLTGKTFQEFFEENFTDLYEIYKDRIYVIGKKLFCRPNSDYVISIEFTGPIKLSYVNITFTASTKYGVIDITEVPLSRIFYEAKNDEMEKTVITKMLTSSGKSNIQWSTDITEEDHRSLNEIVMKYIDVFCAGES